MGWGEAKAVQEEYLSTRPASACLRAGKKMKFSTVLFLWQIQLLWGLVQSGVTSKRQKLKTWQLMKRQMTGKFRQGPSIGSKRLEKNSRFPSLAAQTPCSDFFLFSSFLFSLLTLILGQRTLTAFGLCFA